MLTKARALEPCGTIGTRLHIGAEAAGHTHSSMTDIPSADPVFANPRRAERVRLLRDLREGIRLRGLWLFLGWRDVRKHYRRSVLGPFWLTLSLGILVAGLGVLYSQIFRMEISTYLPFLGVGFIVWTLIGNTLNGACSVFIGATASIRQMPLPLSVHIFQFAWAQLISFGHNILIYFLILLIFSINPGFAALLFFPALTLLLLNVVFFTMLLGPISARFRDLPMIVSSLVQVAFFMTPILWSAEQLPERAFFVYGNPFYHFVEISRKPLLGEYPAVDSWVICTLLTALLGVVALAFFARYRARIAYWV